MDNDLYTSANSSVLSASNEKLSRDAPDGQVVSLKQLLCAAVDAATRGGDEVRRIREEATLNQSSKGKTKEGVNDPVTDGDFMSHLVMFYSLKKAFPTLEIVSEEHDDAKGNPASIESAKIENSEVEKYVLSDEIVYAKDVMVWIDPLDATKEYTEDLRDFVTTMVGVAVKGVPVLGVVHRPFSHVTHWGWVGHGLSPDLQTIKNAISAESATPTVARIVVSISHKGTVADVAVSAFGDQTDIISAAGAGYKILEVIQGKADAYVHTTAIKKWDLCAGHAILSAMGGTLTTLSAVDNGITYEDRTKYKIDQGLLATLKMHEYYLKKLQALKQA
ncbi:Inositol monophosphatase-like [Trinorchestia longiramus]|nr:Inositol monophosphatase-like [Trinorchestia longiramus]